MNDEASTTIAEFASDGKRTGRGFNAPCVDRRPPECRSAFERALRTEGTVDLRGNPAQEVTPMPHYKQKLVNA